MTTKFDTVIIMGEGFEINISEVTHLSPGPTQCLSHIVDGQFFTQKQQLMKRLGTLSLQTGLPVYHCLLQVITWCNFPVGVCLYGQLFHWATHTFKV